MAVQYWTTGASEDQISLSFTKILHDAPLSGAEEAENRQLAVVRNVSKHGTAVD
jgi:hypothetical protein